MPNTIMMIDDDANIRRIAELTLTCMGNWNVVLAESGYQALEKIPQVRPDVILLDVMMPGMDGLTTLAKIRELPGGNVPVIFMTAKVQTHEVQSYLSHDVVGIITKPFDPVTLSAQIEKMCRMKIAC